MKFLTNAEEAKHNKEVAESYNKGFKAGRSAAHEEDFVQDINFVDVIYAFDFYNPNIKVFSVERTNPGTSDETTVIGYLDKEGIVKQWYFHCSRSHHNKLVEQWLEAKRSPFVKKK